MKKFNEFVAESTNRFTKYEPGQVIDKKRMDWLKLGAANSKITIKENYEVDIEGDFNTGIFGEDRFPVNFGTVSGNFDCSLSALTTLEGGPIFVGKKFDCSGCTRLNSFEHAPLLCHIFSGHNCAKVTELKMSKTVVNGSFSISNCDLLKNLIGSPSVVGKNFIANDMKSLESLEGITDSIHGWMTIRTCKKLKTLKGGPTVLWGDVLVDHENLGEDERDLSIEMIKVWWKSKLSLDIFLKRYKGAVKLNRYDL